MENINFNTVLAASIKTPGVRIYREEFLRKELCVKYSKDIVEKAIKNNPAYAGITVEEINIIADSCITAETLKVSGLSFLAGLPGGLAMIGTIPADFIQYFAHILRILQKLIYLYGWEDLDFNADKINDETANLIILFVGIMFGVNGSVNTINKISTKVALNVAKKLPQKALTNTIYYPIIKKIAGYLGVQMTKKIFSNGISKFIPIIGGFISGGVTCATYKTMAVKLKNNLANSVLADVNYYKKKK